MRSDEKQPGDMAAAMREVHAHAASLAEQRKGVSIAETARQQEEAEKLTGPMLRSFKCAVRGCNNHFGEGHFVGALCFPCDAMLRSGVVPSGGATFIHDLYYDVQRLEAKERVAKANALLAEALDKDGILFDRRQFEVIVGVILRAFKQGEEDERLKGQS